MPVLINSEISYARSLLNNPPKNTNTSINAIHSSLSLISHPEGGYFVETDRDPFLIPNPFKSTKVYDNATATTSSTEDGLDDSPTRHASTSIFYYLDPQSPIGVFHRNKGRTVHTLHRGRGVYVLIHADEVLNNNDSNQNSTPLTTSYQKQKARIETFVVGHDLTKGEKLQWIVEGGKFKASFLLPDSEPGDDPGDAESKNGLLISETVVPGFEYADHDFLTAKSLRDWVEESELEELMWLLRKEEKAKLDV